MCNSYEDVIFSSEAVEIGGSAKENAAHYNFQKIRK